VADPEGFGDEALGLGWWSCCGCGCIYLMYI